jgi:hypothetical protein
MLITCRSITLERGRKLFSLQSNMIPMTFDPDVQNKGSYQKILLVLELKLMFKSRDCFLDLSKKI